MYMLEWRVVGTAAIAALLSSTSATAAPSRVQTTASAKIDESAAITVLNNAPLQLLLTIGAPMGIAYTVPASRSSLPASAGGESLGILPLMLASGFLSGTGGSGEVLSVSVGATEGHDDGSGGQKVAAVVAQFN